MKGTRTASSSHMFKPRYLSVYLKDPLPSATTLMPTIKQCLMDIVQRVLEQDLNSSSVMDDNELPTEFRSKPCRKRRRRALPSHRPSEVFDHVMLFADEVTHDSSYDMAVYLRRQQESTKWWPCVVRGLGSSSSEDHPSLLIQLVDASRSYPAFEVLLEVKCCTTQA